MGYVLVGQPTRAELTATYLGKVGRYLPRYGVLCTVLRSTNKISPTKSVVIETSIFFFFFNFFAALYPGASSANIHKIDSESVKMAPPKPAKPAKAPLSPAKKGYLILYNFVNAVCWLTVLGRVVGLLTTRGPSYVYLGVGEWTKWTQTVAGMEVLHAALGTYGSLSVCMPLRTSICAPN
jgi:hypothetical protein